jgi:hypothetical protein
VVKAKTGAMVKMKIIITINAEKTAIKANLFGYFFFTKLNRTANTPAEKIKFSNL